jgi:outer membrane protein OmpA-like peptidoglycan-associated protein
MIRKTLLLLFITIFMSLPAMAIEPPEGAAIPWGRANNAYTSTTYNDVLVAYGLNLAADSANKTPATYAKASADKVMFNDRAIAYSPKDYHAILTAYGLLLSPEDVRAKLGSVWYASAQSDKVTFGKNSVAYNEEEWKTILSAYSMPMKEAGAVVMEKATGMPGDSDGDGVADDKDACPGTPKGVMVDDRGCWSYPSKLLFDFDKAVVKSEYKSNLGEAKKVFDAYPTMTVQIVGYTCDLGPESYNQKLSERRAKAVRDFLVNEVGVDSNRINVSGAGESRPAYPNDSEANRKKNRRVEFIPKL